MTATRRKQLAHRAKGICDRCSEPLVSKRFCEKHRLQVNRLRLARYWRQKIAGEDVTFKPKKEL